MIITFIILFSNNSQRAMQSRIYVLHAAYLANKSNSDEKKDRKTKQQTKTEKKGKQLLSSINICLHVQKVVGRSINFAFVHVQCECIVHQT